MITNTPVRTPSYIIVFLPIHIPSSYWRNRGLTGKGYAIDGEIGGERNDFSSNFINNLIIFSLKSQMSALIPSSTDLSSTSEMYLLIFGLLMTAFFVCLGSKTLLALDNSYKVGCFPLLTQSPVFFSMDFNLVTFLCKSRHSLSFVNISPLSCTFFSALSALFVFSEM